MMRSTAWCILALKTTSAFLNIGMPQSLRGMLPLSTSAKNDFGVRGPDKEQHAPKVEESGNNSDEEGYILSVYDPQARKYFAGHPTVKGYALNHSNPNKIKKFGNLSVLSLNAHVERDTLDGLQKDAIIELIDSHHPSVFGLQSVSKRVMQDVIDSIKTHYSVANSTQKAIDIRTRREEYKPIFYDSRVLTKIMDGVFEPKDTKDQSYASFAVFKKTSSADYFTVVNGDLYSAERTAIDALAFNIVVDFKKSYFKDYPVFYLGTINAIGRKLGKLMNMNDDEIDIEDLGKTHLENLVEKDTKNRNASRNTFHSHGNFDDGVQRDFILLYDPKKRFDPKYTKILDHFDSRSFAHYPVFSILTLTPPQRN